MDRNNQFEFEQDERQYAPMMTVKNARYFRGRAREALKGNWVTASLASLVFTLMQALTASVGVPIMLLMIFAAEATAGLEKALFLFLALLVGYAAMLAVMLFVVSPLTVGYSHVHLKLIDGQKPEIDSMFSYFKKAYWKSVGITAWQMLFVFGWTCLVFVFQFLELLLFRRIGESKLLFIALFAVFMVAGVALLLFILYRYIMAPFILAEYPEMRAIDALRSSAVLMKGRKWKLFCMQLSFIGWVLVYFLASVVTLGLGGLVGQFVLTAYMQTSLAAFYHEAANRDASKDVEFPSIDPDDYVVD